MGGGARSAAKNCLRNFFAGSRATVPVIPAKPAHNAVIAGDPLRSDSRPTRGILAACFMLTKERGSVLPGNSSVEPRDFPIPEPDLAKH